MSLTNNDKELDSDRKCINRNNQYPQIIHQNQNSGSEKQPGWFMIPRKLA